MKSIIYLIWPIVSVSTRQMSTKKNGSLGLLYKPKSENQKLYVNTLNQKEDYIIGAFGPAGTGKTLLACCKAIDSLKKEKIDKIIITRPVVSVEEDIGFLPGNLVKKMDPWTRPIFDIFSEYYPKSEITNMINNGRIEISPLGFMRGRTFKNAFVIADEMQNASPNQMLMLMTRIGTDSRMVITGDLKQSDRLENNGLKDFITRYKNVYKENDSIKNIYLIEFDEMDIQRSDLVKQVLEIYKEKEQVIVKQIKRPQIIFPITRSETGDAALIPKSDMFKNLDL